MVSAIAVDRPETLETLVRFEPASGPGVAPAVPSLGSTWRLCCCPDHVCTPALAAAPDPTVARLKLHFAVSTDEEHVRVRVTSGARAFDVGDFAYNYLLLTLARRRLHDAAIGLPESACGWLEVDEVRHDPSLAPPNLNVYVCRIRKRFSTMGLVDAHNIVERRVRTRELRIGTAWLTIVRG